MTDTSVNYVTAPTSLSDNNTDSCENVPESTSDDSKTKASGAPKAVTSSSLSTSSSSALAVMDERLTTDVESVYPMKRHEVLKWYGWGYKDAEFFIKDETIWFRGENYPLHGKPLPLFTQWVMGTFKCLLHEGLHRPELPKNLPQPTINQEFLKNIKSSGITHSFDGVDRFMRCHGQTIRDIYNVNFNTFQRIPDIVTWPTCHDDVVVLVNMAHRCNVVIIPYGGGTSVSGAVTCPQNEERMICLLDTSQMNRMLWINKSNLTVCFEAGVVGQDLERTLRAQGVTVGHEPDSYEFSTLGGWVATRASGMKKNVYGNIEDLVVQVKMVTPSGVLERQCTAPRISCGPDFNHVIMGSEGMLGVVTEVVLKIRPLPKVTRYNSLVFATFESGVEFMREVAKRRCQPSSIRLMDNEQFILGQCLKPPKDWKGEIKDYISKKYVTLIKGIDLTQICAATLLFEGDQDEVSRHEELIISIAKKHKGFAGGSENGERGYILTFVIAYIRDLGFQHDIVAESFETSVPWDRCYRLCMNVKQRVVLECHARSVMHFSVSCRVTQTYDAGACVYFYFAFNFRGFDNPVDLYQQIEDAARDEIIDNGGSISHHHGVGKMRSPWYQQSVTKTGVELFQATKKRLDPNNIFALGNLLPTECQEEDAKSSLSSTKRGNVKVMSKL